MEQLKKCPFCGGEAELTRNEVFYWFRCEKCDVDSGKGRTVDLAKERWNTRKPMENIIERIENEILEELSDCGDDWFTAEQINKAIEIVRSEM